jgi:hypothetical protein
MSEHNTRAHSRFGGSKAERWLNCASSVALGDLVPEQPSRYAAEGTRAHEIAAYCLQRSLSTSRAPAAQQFLADKGWTEEDVPVDMLDAVDVYLDAVWAEVNRFGDGLNAEMRIESTFVLDNLEGADKGEVFGSNDCIVYHPLKKRLAVFDYKHGVGVSVASEDNAQLKFYALGAVLDADLIKGRGVTDIELVIVQPRALDAEAAGAVKSWTWDLADVLEFKVDIEEAIFRAKVMRPFFVGAKKGEFLAADAMPGGAPAYATGDWCRFCPAAAICPAKEKQALDAAGLDFASVAEITTESLPTVEAMTPDKLGQVLAAIGIFTEWGEQIRQHIEALLRAGKPVPGWKIVAKQGRAKWIDDEQKIAGFLALQGVDPELARPRKLVTITEAERLLKGELDGDELKSAKEELRLRYTIKESSGTTLAPASDKRDAVDAVAADFGGVNLAA